LDIERMTGRDLPRDQWVLVARQGCVTVGFIELQRRSEITVELQTFFIRPLARGSGAGIQLVRSAMEAIMQRGFHDLTIGAAAFDI
jgi:GNAT superfamily N-acetyltransferase